MFMFQNTLLIHSNCSIAKDAIVNYGMNAPYSSKRSSAVIVGDLQISGSMKMFQIKLNKRIYVSMHALNIKRIDD